MFKRQEKKYYVNNESYNFKNCFFFFNLQMYQKRHYGSNGPKPNNIFAQQHQPDSQSKFNNSYTQLHFENSLGKVLVCKMFHLKLV